MINDKFYVILNESKLNEMNGSIIFDLFSFLAFEM